MQNQTQNQVQGTTGESNAPFTTVYCIAREGDVGGVSWFSTPEQRAAAERFCGDVLFDLDVPAGSSQDAVTRLADDAAWNKLYLAGKTCRVVACIDDPEFRAQLQGLKDVTAAMNGVQSSQVVLSTDKGRTGPSCVRN